MRLRKRLTADEIRARVGDTPTREYLSLLEYWRRRTSEDTAVQLAFYATADDKEYRALKKKHGLT